MNTWHNNMSRIVAVRDICHSMFVAHDLYTVITRPAIRSDLRSNLHVISDETPKAWCRQVRNSCHANSARTTASHFCRDCDDRFTFSTSTTNLRPNSPNVCFIDFNLFGQLVPPGTNHCTTKLVKPIPRGIIAAKTKNPLQSESAGSMFLACHKPHCKKPGAKRLMASVKQRSSNDGSLTFTSSAKEKATPHQRWNTSFFSTTGANETFLPSKFHDIFNASIFAAKPFIKFLKGSRIVNARKGCFCSSMATFYILWSVE